MENADAPAVREITEEFLRLGVICFDNNNHGAIAYTTTDLGKAWVQALCNVPIPRTAFIDEQGRVL